MKKTIKLVGLALIAMSVMPIASCSGDDKDVTPPGQDDIENETGMRLTRVGNDRYSYDSEGRCIAVRTSDYSFTIDWDKGEIFTGDSDDPDGTILNFKTNGKGYITEFSESWDYEDFAGPYKGNAKCVLTYDKSGHLIKSVYHSEGSGSENGHEFEFEGEMIHNLTWEDGNLVHVNSFEDYTENGEREVYDYSYEISYNTNQENVYKQWTEGMLLNALDGLVYTELGHIGAYGVGSVNFPVNIYAEEGNSTNNYSIKISTNSDGLISKEVLDGETLNYVYDQIGTRSEVFDQILPAKNKKNHFFLRRHRMRK